jgi:hypothetical protein
MTPETEASLPFDTWKLLLHKDCEMLGKLDNFTALGDSVLAMLWKRGVAPSVQAIIDAALQAEAKAS